MGSMLVSVNTLINEYDLDLLNLENLIDWWLSVFYLTLTLRSDHETR